MEKKIYTIGVDPGATGAAVLLVNGRWLDYADFTSGPEVVDTLLAWMALYGIRAGIIEQVSAMPKQGVTSSFNFGANYGWWQGAFDAFKIPYKLVRPQNWQKGLVPKKRSVTDKPGLLVARRMWPLAPLKLKKHHNRADAALMAYVAWREISLGRGQN